MSIISAIANQPFVLWVKKGAGYDCELMALSTNLSVKEDLSSRLEHIDLLGCGGIFYSLAAKLLTAHGAPGGVEVRALMGRVDLFVVDRESSSLREGQGIIKVWKGPSRLRRRGLQ